MAAHEKGEKRCVECRKTFPLSNFYQLGRRNGREYSPRCRPCANRYAGAQNQKPRLLVLNHYSGGTMQCAGCGETRLACLDLDHLFGNGAEHRRISKNAYTLFRRIIRENYPAYYQVLCRNCNWVKHLARMEGDRNAKI